MAIIYKHIRKNSNEVFYIGIDKSEIVGEGLTWEEACNKEQKLIKLYGRRDKQLGSLVNMSDGGYGMIVSHKTKEKIECPYCGKMDQPALAYIWDFDNCKNKG